MDQTVVLAIVGDLELSRREALLHIAQLQAEVKVLKAQLADPNKGGIEVDKVDKL